MKVKKMMTAFLSAVMCVSMFSMTAFAYAENSPDSSTEATESTEETTEEVPYSVSVDEDGTVVFSLNGAEWKYSAEDDGIGTGKVITNGSRLNVRNGAGLNYEIIDQLRPGDEVKVLGVDGDWYQITVPEKNGYVYKDYLEVIEKAQQNNIADTELLTALLNMFAQSMNGSDSFEEALTPDGNLTLVDDVGSPNKTGKQFITAVTKNGNYFYIIIDRDDKGEETVHFLNQVDEADLLSLMDEDEAAQYTKQKDETASESQVQETEPEPEVTEPVQPKKSKPNMIPAVLALLVLIGGGAFFMFKKVQEKKKEKEAAKPDPDADYVEDEDYGYSEENEEINEESEEIEEEDLT